MSQRADLSPAQARVLAHLERVFPAACSAEDAAADLDLSVSAALATLETLRRLGYARFGQGAPAGTPAAAVYEATPQRR
jgi:DNA-binding MarR family transcriptional regulator